MLNGIVGGAAFHDGEDVRPGLGLSVAAVEGGATEKRPWCEGETLRVTRV